jgi:hypothetical protein
MMQAGIFTGYFPYGHPNIPMIIEHLDESDVPRAKKFLDGKLRAQEL